LLGSIPFGYLLVRMFLGKDVRETGSGNIGATNVARSSPGLGAATLLLDALKGAAAVMFAMWIARNGNGHATMLVGAPEPLATASQLTEPVREQMYVLEAIAALFAIAGHMFPVWLKFRGGKGVATAVGSFALLAPQAVLGSLVVFLLVTLTSRYVSVGSMLAAATFPLFAWFLYRNEFPQQV